MATTYDVSDVNVSIDGTILTGFSEGDAISVEKMEDNFTEHVGVKGEVAVAETNNNVAELTVVLQATSPSVAFLDGLAGRKGDNAIVSAQIIDLTTNGVSSGGSQARVTKPATKGYSNELPEREFVIRIFDYSTDA